MTVITKQLAKIQRRIAAAAEAAGRDPARVRILAVSKRQPDEKVRAAIASGLTEFGENYVQDAVKRIQHFGSGADWHFVGRVQSNKTRLIAEYCDWVQTLDSPKIAERLARQRPHYAQPLQVCIQLRAQNSSRDGGCDPAALPALLNVIDELPRLHLRGLMIMPAAGRSEIELKQEFSAAYRLYDELRARRNGIDTLSMGMSGDYELAVSAGSTMVRIGTELFGERMEQ